LGTFSDRINGRWDIGRCAVALESVRYRARRLQSLALLLVSFTPPIAPTAIATRFGKTFGKDVQRPVAYEAVYRLRYLDHLGGLILQPRPEVHPVILHLDQSPIGYRTSVHIASKLLDDVSQIAARLGWRLNVNHPVTGFHFTENPVDGGEILNLQHPRFEQSLDASGIPSLPPRH
jgi:hypothetical protein